MDIYQDGYVSTLGGVSDENIKNYRQGLGRD